MKYIRVIVKLQVGQRQWRVVNGGTSTVLGQRLYEQQSIEIDARNFAMDILDKFEQKQIA